MRILTLTWSSMNSYGGIQAHISRLAEGFISRGCSATTLMLPSIKREDPKDERMPISGFPEHFKNVLVLGKYDIIHAHSLNIQDTEGVREAIVRLAIERQVPLFVTVHDIGSKVLPHEFRQSIESLSGAKFIVTSQFIKNRFNTFVPDVAVDIIPPCIDFDQFKGSSSPEARTVACPGRLVSTKGILEAMTCLGELTTSVGPLRMLLSDDALNYFGRSNAYASALHRTATDYPNLEVKSVSGPNAVPEIYWTACLTLCIPKGEEGFGLVPLESLASGRPVVVFPTGGLAWILGTPGVLVLKSRDPQEVKRAIWSVLEQPIPWLTAAVDSRARLRALYDKNVVADAHLQLFTEALRQGRV